MGRGGEERRGVEWRRDEKEVEEIGNEEKEGKLKQRKEEKMIIKLKNTKEKKETKKERSERKKEAKGRKK